MLLIQLKTKLLGIEGNRTSTPTVTNRSHNPLGFVVGDQFEMSRYEWRVSVRAEIAAGDGSARIASRTSPSGYGLLRHESRRLTSPSPGRITVEFQNEKRQQAGQSANQRVTHQAGDLQIDS